MQREEHRIAMRDGTRLQTFLLHPDGDAGPRPALLARCTYGTRLVEEQAVPFVEAGYTVVAQNIRGRLGSEGKPPARSSTSEDGYDTIDWIVAQEWCDGNVGTFGASALARAQTATAFLAHPAHRAMCPRVLPFGMMSRLGGAPMFSQIPMWLYFAMSGPELNPYEGIDWMPHLFKLPVTSVLDDLGGPIETYREVVTHPNVHYFENTPPEHFARMHTPNLMVTGWYDHCGTGPFDFLAMTRRHAGEFQNANTHLVVGPWDHSCDPDLIDPYYDFGPQKRVDLRADEVAFFDRHLRGRRDVEPPPPVRIFVMGANRWRDESDWPLARAVETKLFLHAGQDGPVGGGRRGTLAFETPGEQKPDRFTYDPADPVPTVGGANSAPARVLPMNRGPRDQRPVLDRDDVLVYQTTPLQRPIEVTGHLKLVLWAASSARDTDFTGKLMDVAPDGDARILTDGIIRARFRNGVDSPDLLTPGQVERYEIDLWFTSNQFQAGHRIALAVSSSNFPRINRNLNTGGDNERDAQFTAADQTIFHDAARPSHLLLPVVAGN